jgi:radical SAM protein with 4Fe4S-binding SPASM domain
MLKDLMAKGGNALRALATRRVGFECDRLPFELHHVSIKKLINWILLETSSHIRAPRPWGFPTHVQVEPTTRCNLRCLLCPVTSGMNRPGGDMDGRLFQKILQEMGDYLFLVLLWDWGEPFLNPNIYEMIASARARGIKVISSTNIHPFANRSKADQLVKSGLDTLILAVDGLTQETYQHYRVGGSLASVFTGIENIVARKRALNSPTPRLNLRFTVNRRNEPEIPRLKDLARSLGVDVLTLNKLHYHRQDTEAEKRELTAKIYRELLPLNRSYHRFQYDPQAQRLRRRKNPCKQLWNNPCFHWDGTVCPCSFDHEEGHILGDLKTTPFKDIWLGAPYRRLRRQFRRAWEELPLCRECSYAYKGGDCARENIIEAVFYPN